MSTIGNRRIKRMIRNKRDHHASLFIFLAVLVAAVLIAGLVMPDKGFSANENRSLAQRPKISVNSLKDGSFFKDYTTYYSDQFPLRDLWMSLKFRVDYLLNQREFSDVYVGEKGTLLQKPAVPDAAAVQGTGDAINRFVSKYPEKDFSMILVPDAATIWNSKLPKNAPVRNQVTDIENMLGLLDGSIERIDAVSVLQSHAAENIYYKTDHHWTSEGAYDVFMACTDPLKLAHEGIAYSPHVVSETFQGTLSSRSGDHRTRDEIIVYEPQGTDVEYEVNYPDLQQRSCSLFVSELLNEKDQYTVFFGGNHPLVEIRTTADNGRSLLIFKDSYANSFIQFLTPYYQTIVMVDPRYYYDDVSLAMNTYSVTDVMFLYSADTLLTDTALADVLNAATAESGAEETGESLGEAMSGEIAVPDENTDGSGTEGTETEGTSGDDSSEESTGTEEYTEDYTEDYSEDYSYEAEYSEDSYSRHLKTLSGEYMYG